MGQNQAATEPCGTCKGKRTLPMKNNPGVRKACYVCSGSGKVPIGVNTAQSTKRLHDFYLERHDKVYGRGAKIIMAGAEKG